MEFKTFASWTKVVVVAIMFAALISTVTSAPAFGRPQERSQSSSVSREKRFVVEYAEKHSCKLEVECGGNSCGPGRTCQYVPCRGFVCIKNSSYNNW